MRMQWATLISVLGIMAGCASSPSTKPVEYLDDRTAMTVGALKKPIELLPSGPRVGVFQFGKRPSFAYLGPIEWDRSGSLVYGLWIHIAPGNERPMADIRAPSTLTLMLDDGPVVLTAIDAPQLGQGAYQPVASWGQTGYFGLTVEMLKRMAASKKLELDVRNADDSIVIFVPTEDTSTTLTQYLHARGITGD
jgi:hypothetical protein